MYYIKNILSGRVFNAFDTPAEAIFSAVSTEFLEKHPNLHLSENIKKHIFMDAVRRLGTGPRQYSVELKPNYLLGGFYNDRKEKDLVLFDGHGRIIPANALPFTDIKKDKYGNQYLCANLDGIRLETPKEKAEKVIRIPNESWKNKKLFRQWMKNKKDSGVSASFRNSTRYAQKEEVI